jgi:hypothetical protein
MLDEIIIYCVFVLNLLLSPVLKIITSLITLNIVDKQVCLQHAESLLVFGVCVFCGHV